MSIRESIRHPRFSMYLFLHYSYQMYLLYIQKKHLGNYDHGRCFWVTIIREDTFSSRCRYISQKFGYLNYLLFLIIFTFSRVNNLIGTYSMQDKNRICKQLQVSMVPYNIKDCNFKIQIKSQKIQNVF
jgi:hypothetical protein